MKQRFIISANNATAAQKDQITIFLKNQGFGYWHWFNDIWLVTDRSGIWKAA